VSKPIAIMGTGSWGTTFAHLLDQGNNPIQIWGNDLEVISSIKSTRSNHKYHSEIVFSPQVEPMETPDLALSNSQLVVLAMPAQRLRENLEAWAKTVPTDAIVISLIKGLEHDTGLRVSQVVKQHLSNPFGVISGPEGVAIQIQELCSSPRFKLFRSSDVIGVEIAGTTKNIIALATGIAIGLGLGENAQSAILTRGLSEMAKIGVAAGGSQKTFLGLSGIGDLIATSQSPYSRNRTFGVLLGQGKSMSEAKIQIGQTVEAMQSTEPILQLAHLHQLDVPVISQVSQILNGLALPESILEIFESSSHQVENY
jgi:glycerol-3-phosphate dehydrogenase (NAD(P)+)